MSEQFESPRYVGEGPAEDDGGQPVEPAAPGVAREHTGNHDVDRVLASLEGLGDLPIDEHVAVFERAHESLRGALDGPRPPRP